MLESTKDIIFTYIRKAMSTRNIIQQHNSGIGYVSTEPLHIQNYALFAYIYGFDLKMIYYSTLKYYRKEEDIY